MDRQTILSELKAILVEQLGVEPDEITEEKSFQEDLNVDSLDTVEMLMEIEDRLKVKIPDEDAKGLETVKDIIDYVEKTKATDQVEA